MERRSFLELLGLGGIASIFGAKVAEAEETDNLHRCTTMNGHRCTIASEKIGSGVAMFVARVISDSKEGAGGVRMEGMVNNKKLAGTLTNHLASLPCGLYVEMNGDNLEIQAEGTKEQVHWVSKIEVIKT